MKDKILKILKYILQEYPYKAELSASRVTKILYLADWKSSIDNGRQLTDSTWYFNHYGPYVEDFIELAKEDDDIEVVNEQTMFGGRKRLLKLTDLHKDKVQLDDNDKALVDFVINATKSKNYEEFIKLVYSTYPVITHDRYSVELVPLAAEYKQILAKECAS
ncbi:MAG: Panacea domain-containing protein [Methylococcaceae bacterium]